MTQSDPAGVAEVDHAIADEVWTRFYGPSRVKEFLKKRDNDWLAKLFARHRLAATERLEAENAWRPITDIPSEPTNVEFYFGRVIWRDTQGRPAMQDHPMRDDLERRSHGWWDGECWRESGTSHEVFEDWRSDEQLPTHWRPLLPPPAKQEKRNGQG